MQINLHEPQGVIRLGPSTTREIYGLERISSFHPWEIKQIQKYTGNPLGGRKINCIACGVTINGSVAAYGFLEFDDKRLRIKRLGIDPTRTQKAAIIHLLMKQIKTHAIEEDKSVIQFEVPFKDITTLQLLSGEQFKSRRETDSFYVMEYPIASFIAHQLIGFTGVEWLWKYAEDGKLLFHTCGAIKDTKQTCKKLRSYFPNVSAEHTKRGQIIVIEAASMSLDVLNELERFPTPWAISGIIPYGAGTRYRAFEKEGWENRENSRRRRANKDQGPQP